MSDNPKTFGKFIGSPTASDLGPHGYAFDADTDGGLWVTGTGFMTIPFRKRPHKPEASFLDVPNCGPGPDPSDVCTATAENVGSKFRPRWFLRVSWNVGTDVRLLAWHTEN